MFTNSLSEILERDLRKLIAELHGYQEEKNIWVIKPGISNSAGNLSLHLVGNLNHFIGATLDYTGYVRNREAEFALKNISRATMVKSLEDTIVVVKSAIEKLSDTDLEKEYPLEPFGKKITTGFMLLHLATHLTYHLGQVNYHRRFIENDTER